MSISPLWSRETTSFLKTCIGVEQPNQALIRFNFYRLKRRFSRFKRRGGASCLEEWTKTFGSRTHYKSVLSVCLSSFLYYFICVFLSSDYILILFILVHILVPLCISVFHILVYKRGCLRNPIHPPLGLLLEFHGEAIQYHPYCRPYWRRISETTVHHACD